MIAHATIGAMFLRPNHREKDGKRHIYWSLVETVRTADGPRQRTLCHLGELNDSAQARWMVARAITGRKRVGLHYIANGGMRD